MLKMIMKKSLYGICINPWGFQQNQMKKSHYGICNTIDLSLVQTVYEFLKLENQMFMFMLVDFFT